MEWLTSTLTAIWVVMMPPAKVDERPVKLPPGKCPVMRLLAQEHSNDMARRDHLDHDGFYSKRAPRGARAENVAYGCPDEACAVAMWRRSPPHAMNMLLPGCRAVASAVSQSGKRYWTMEIAR